MFFTLGRSKCRQCVFNRGSRCLLSKSSWWPCSLGTRKIDEVQKVETHLQFVMSRNAARTQTTLSITALFASALSLIISYNASELNQDHAVELIDSRVSRLSEAHRLVLEDALDAKFRRALQELRDQKLSYGGERR